MKVLNFGSLNLDYVYQVEHFVQPGETLSATSQQVNCGGKGLNQSIALARAGAEVYHAGCVGVGGEKLREELMANGVDIAHLISTEELQGNAIIQVDKKGENCILLFGGSNRVITSEQIDVTLEKFEQGDYVVLQNEVNRLEEIIKKAYQKGLRIVLNPSPFEEQLRNLDFHMISWLLVNEIEAEQISGKREPEEAWKQLHEQYPKLCMVVTLGGEGSVCFTPQETVYQKACKVQAADTTAAGDTFTGYFIEGMMRGLPLEECMKRATIASAISVTRKGAAASIPTKAEVDELVAGGREHESN